MRKPANGQSCTGMYGIERLALTLVGQCLSRGSTLVDDPCCEERRPRWDERGKTYKSHRQRRREQARFMRAGRTAN